MKRSLKWVLLPLTLAWPGFSISRAHAPSSPAVPSIQRRGQPRGAGFKISTRILTATGAIAAGLGLAFLSGGEPAGRIPLLAWLARGQTNINKE